MAIIRGTNGNETLNGTPNNDQIFGLGGDDRLFGRGGNDTLFGGRGDDRTDGGAGSDTFSVRDAPYSWTIDLAADAALAFDEFNQDRTFDEDAVIAIENVDGSAQPDLIDGDGQANTLLGNGGSDELDGRGGNDVLRGGAAGDRLVGGSGNDLIDGGGGSDLVDYTFDSGAQAIRLDLASGQARRGSEVDRLVGVEDAFGNEGDDTLLGNGSANTLYGYGGDDTIDGRGGSDEVQGYNGDDLLRGGAGNDLVDNGTGSDRFTGDAGADVFRSDYFSYDETLRSSGDDTVTDFSRNQGDKLDIGVTREFSAELGNPFDQLDTNDNGRIDNADGSSTFGDVRLDSAVSGGSTVLSFEDTGGSEQVDSLQLTVEDVTDLRQSDFVL